MNKVYNTQEEIASEMKDFLLKSNPNITKRVTLPMLITLFC